MTEAVGIVPYGTIIVNKQLIRLDLSSIIPFKHGERPYMTATKRKLLYSLVVLLFLLVILLIGWLAHVLLAARVVPPPTGHAPVASVRQRQPGEGAFSETVINVESPAEPVDERPAQGEALSGADAASGSSGPIPCICEGYGPQIRSRDAYPNPLTHQTVFSATRAVVTLTLQPEVPRGEP
jgi:hypothetical protein